MYFTTFPIGFKRLQFPILTDILSFVHLEDTGVHRIGLPLSLECRPWVYFPTLITVIKMLECVDSRRINIHSFNIGVRPIIHAPGSQSSKRHGKHVGGPRQFGLSLETEQPNNWTTFPMMGLEDETDTLIPRHVLYCILCEGKRERREWLSYLISCPANKLAYNSAVTKLGSMIITLPPSVALALLLSLVAALFWLTQSASERRTFKIHSTCYKYLDFCVGLTL